MMNQMTSPDEKFESMIADTSAADFAAEKIRIKAEKYPQYAKAIESKAMVAQEGSDERQAWVDREKAELDERADLSAKAEPTIDDVAKIAAKNYELYAYGNHLKDAADLAIAQQADVDPEGTPILNRMSAVTDLITSKFEGKDLEDGSLQQSAQHVDKHLDVYRDAAVEAAKREGVTINVETPKKSTLEIDDKPLAKTD